jgi:hypothetical protein
VGRAAIRAAGNRQTRVGACIVPTSDFTKLRRDQVIIRDGSLLMSFTRVERFLC